MPLGIIGTETVVVEAQTAGEQPDTVNAIVPTGPAPQSTVIHEVPNPEIIVPPVTTHV